MKISLNWLNDFVNISDLMHTPEVIAERLTAAGLEVEGIEKLGAFEYLKVGKILELAKHPDADKLTVCQVDVADGQIHQIVCGAKNHKAGDVVCVALPGCVLPGDFKIKKSKIRGVESAGMLCSESELGLAETSEGIKILPQDAPLGMDVSEYLGIKDNILEISVTPNRADCLSHWGLAREVSCLLGRSLKVLNPQVLKSQNSLPVLPVAIEIKNATACPRFSGILLQNVKVGPSPAWLKQRLENCGMNSINNVVDITNYVMLELGQPMHAYDAHFIEGDKVVVENSHAGETFTSFDGTEYVLTGEELCIRDTKKTLGLAGVVGSKNSGIQDKTTNVFLEVAYFLPSSVRKTARRFGIETDAGYRFSRGTDVDAVVLASLRACELFVELAGAQVASQLQDVYPQPLTASKIKIRLQDLTERLGFVAEADKFELWLTRLFCDFTKIDEVYEVTPPSFRYDFFCKEDLIEEYGRLEGYDKIPEILPQMQDFPTPQDMAYVQTNVLGQIMTGLGFNQAYNYNFFSSAEESKLLGDVARLANWNVGHAHEKVKLRNPLNENLDVMRSSLAPQLFSNALHNWKYGREYGQLFESGSVFYKQEGVYQEEARLAGIYWGIAKEYWSSVKQESAWPVMKLKSALEVLFQKLGITSYKFQNIDSEIQVPFYHPGQWAQVVVQGKVLGLIGSVHPAILEEHKVRVPMAFFEIASASLFQGYPRHSKVKPLVYYPIVQRDVTFEVAETVKFDDLVQVISKAVGKKLIDIRLKDIYKGERLAKGEHAITLSLSLQDESKILEDAALDQIQTSVFKAVETHIKSK